MAKVLTPAAAMEIKRLYEETDSLGRRIYSQLQIAGMLGVSETTVFRVIHKAAAYAKVRDLPSTSEADASLARFAAEHPELIQMNADIAKARERNELPAKMLAELKTTEVANGIPDAGYGDD